MRFCGIFVTFLFGFQIFGMSQAADFSEIDQYVQNVPKTEKKSIERLTSYLIAPYQTDLEKVRSIYTWIGMNIKYDHKGIEQDKLTYNHDAEEVLNRGKGVCTGFANLFNEMSQYAGIESMVVSGYSKDALTSEVNPNVPDHVWNVVKVKGEWMMLDVTWDAGLWKNQDHSGQQRKDTYFLPPSLVFLQDHLPAMPMWQLVDAPYSMQDYLTNQIPLSDSSQLPYFSEQLDQIVHYNRLARPEQRLFEYRETYRFNPTEENGKEMAHGLLDYAGILVDRLDIMEHENHANDRKQALLREVIGLCAESKRYTEFHDWQSRICADAINSYVVNSYNEAIKMQPSDPDIYEVLIKELQVAKGYLEGLRDDFQTRGMKMENEQLIEVLQAKLKRVRTNE